QDVVLRYDERLAALRRHDQFAHQFPAGFVLGKTHIITFRGGIDARVFVSCGCAHIASPKIRSPVGSLYLRQNTTRRSTSAMTANKPPPHIASTTRMARENPMSRRLEANSSRYPSPLRPATISATTTPITDRVAEIFMPAKMEVRDAGSSTLANI